MKVGLIRAFEHETTVTEPSNPIQFSGDHGLSLGSVNQGSAYFFRRGIA